MVTEQLLRCIGTRYSNERDSGTLSLFTVDPTLFDLLTSSQPTRLVIVRQLARLRVLQIESLRMR